MDRTVYFSVYMCAYLSLCLVICLRVSAHVRACMFHLKIASYELKLTAVIVWQQYGVGLSG